MISCGDKVRAHWTLQSILSCSDSHSQGTLTSESHLSDKPDNCVMYLVAVSDLLELAA